MPVKILQQKLGSVSLSIGLWTPGVEDTSVVSGLVSVSCLQSCSYSN